MLFTKSHLQSSMKSVIFGVFCQYARISSPGKVQTVKWPVKLFSLAKNDLRTVFRPLLSTLNRPTIALYWQGDCSPNAPWQRYRALWQGCSVRYALAPRAYDRKYIIYTIKDRCLGGMREYAASLTRSCVNTTPFLVSTRKPSWTAMDTAFLAKLFFSSPLGSTPLPTNRP